MTLDVVIKAMDVTSNTLLVFDADPPLPPSQQEGLVNAIRKQFESKGLNPIVFLTNGGLDVEKLPTRMLRQLRDRLNAMELGETHTCLSSKKNEEHCRACHDETR